MLSAIIIITVVNIFGGCGRMDDSLNLKSNVLSSGSSSFSIVARRPKSEAEVFVARVFSLKGKAWILPYEGMNGAIPLVEGMPLYRSDHLLTGQNGRLVIRGVRTHSQNENIWVAFLPTDSTEWVTVLPSESELLVSSLFRVN